MAIEIAKQTGATVKGITLSENQFELHQRLKKKAYPKS